MTEVYKVTSKWVGDTSTIIVSRCKTGGWDVKNEFGHRGHCASASEVVNIFYKDYYWCIWQPEVPRGHELDVEYHKRNGLSGDVRLLMNLDGFYTFVHSDQSKVMCLFEQRCKMRGFTDDDVILVTDRRGVIVSVEIGGTATYIFEDCDLMPLNPTIRDAVHGHLPIAGVSGIVCAYASEFAVTWLRFKLLMTNSRAAHDGPMRVNHFPTVKQHADMIEFYIV